MQYKKVDPWNDALDFRLLKEIHPEVVAHGEYKPGEFVTHIHPRSDVSEVVRLCSCTFTQMFTNRWLESPNVEVCVLPFNDSFSLIFFRIGE